MRWGWRRNSNAQQTAFTPDPEGEDDTIFIKRDCFVVMPFGQKLDSQALTRLAGTGLRIDPAANIVSIDFDRVFDALIEPAVQNASAELELAIECTRSDKIAQSGFIHKDMIQRLAVADVVVVDITTQNANVFYELGVRHCLRRSTTILIRRQGTHIPFNISGMRVFEYDDDDKEDDQGVSPRIRSIKALSDAIVQSFSHR